MRFARNNLSVCFVVLCLALCADAQNALLRFEKSIDEGNLAAVEKELFSYVAANPSDAAGFALLAKLRLKQSRLNEAKSLANKALTLDPNSVSAKLVLAMTFVGTGDTGQARSILADISDKELQNNSIRLKVAGAFQASEDCESALNVAAKLPAAIKNSDALSLLATCYLQSGDDKNLKLLVPFAKAAARQKPKAAVSFAEVTSDAGLHVESAAILRTVILSSRNNADALLLLAKSEIYLKDIRSAQLHLSQAEKLRPGSAEAFYVRSLLEMEQGNPAKALELLENALAINPDDTKFMFRYVIAAMRANYPGRAVRVAEKLVRLQPENPEALYLFGAASLQNKNLQQAENALSEFLRLRPNDGRACVALGLTLATQPERLEEARGQMQNCLKNDPRNFEAAYQLGLSYKANGDNVNAVEYLEQAAKLQPNNAVVLRDLGAAYLQIGDEAKASNALERSVELNVNDAETHFQLSRLYNLTGKRELAKKHLDIFQKLRAPKKEGM